MSILLASDQYTATLASVNATNAASDAAMLQKYGDVFTQITYATSQGSYTTSYKIADINDATAFSGMMTRAGYTITQNSTTFNISWLFVIATATNSALPPNAVGVLTNNGSGVLSWTSTTTTTSITASQITTALGYVPKTFSIAMSAALS